MFEVKVTVDLGEKTLALLTGFAIANKVNEPIAVEAAKPEEVKPEPKPEVVKEEPKRTRRTKEQIAAEEARIADGWDDMDEDAKLEAIKAEVTKNTKKGNSADVKLMLSNFDAGRASELSPSDYDAFYDAIIRYGKGETLDAIFPEDLN